MRRIFGQFPLAALLLSILFAPLSAQADPPELRLAALVELSGPAATVGEEVRRGLEIGRALYVDKARPGKMKLTVLFGDTHDDVKTAISEFRRLVEIEKADVVLISRSKIAMPVNPLASQIGIPVIGGVGHPGFVTGNPNAIRMFPSAEIEGRYLAQAARDAGKSRMAVITLDDEWTGALSKVFSAEFVRLGGTIVSDQLIDPAETELGTIAINVKKSAPDGVFLDLLLLHLGSMAKRLREQRIDAQFYSNYWIQRKDVIDSAGQAVEGAVFSQADTSNKNFMTELNSRFPGTTTLVSTYLAHMSVALVTDAFERSGYDRSRFKAELLKTDKFPSVAGEMQIIGRETQLPVVLKKISGGKVENQ